MNLILKQLKPKNTKSSKNLFDLNNLNSEIKNILDKKLITFEDKIIFLL